MQNRGYQNHGPMGQPGGAPGGNMNGMQGNMNMGPGPGQKMNPDDFDWSIKEGVTDFEKENDFIQFFRYIQGHHSCTHSSMIGPSDHRIPKSGKFDVNKPECLNKLYAAVAFFYRQQKPLVLCEIATSRFRFFEDVDLLLPEELNNDLPSLQAAWVDQLLRHRGAVLGAIWRSDDPLGVKTKGDRATVNVFSSSGWSSRHKQPKISLHFVWPDLIVSPREAKGIRSATIEFLRESCSEDLKHLLNRCYANKQMAMDADMSPWEEIFDKAATDGTSLRLVFCDKGAKADRELKTAARLEGRPKVPVGTYEVCMVAGDASKSVPTVVKYPNDKNDIQWLAEASIRLDGVNIPDVSNIWLSATQTKGIAGIKPQVPVVNPNQQPQPQQIQPAGKDGEDQLSTTKNRLCGKWVDQNSNWMTVQECNPAESHKLQVFLDNQGAQGAPIAELHISPDVYSMPIDITYVALDNSNKRYIMHYQPGTDKYGTWFSADNSEGDSWMWRRPATVEQAWPQWAEFVLIEIAGHADMNERTMGLAAIICAVSNVPTSGKVHGEQYWKGHMSFGPRDFSDDSEQYAVNVPLATMSAVVFGLKALLDLRNRIGGPKIKGIFISSDHTVVEAAIEGQTSTGSPYLDPIATQLNAYKQEILDDENFPNVLDFKVSKIQASANKAAKLAKEARQYATDDDFIGCSMGDIELYTAVISSCEQAAKKGGNQQQNQQQPQPPQAAQVPQQGPPQNMMPPGQQPGAY